eukprot:662693-Prymnesium_polylepis.1
MAAQEADQRSKEGDAEAARAAAQPLAVRPHGERHPFVKRDNLDDNNQELLTVHGQLLLPRMSRHRKAQRDLGSLRS